MYLKCLVVLHLIFSQVAPSLERAYQSERDRREGRNKLVVTTILQAPYMMLRKDGHFLAGNDRFEGFLADMMLSISITLGMDYEIRLARDGKQGGPSTNGTWTGMIGELLRGDADIAMAPFTITGSLAKVVDFTDGFLSLRSTALLKRPRKRKIRIHTAQDLYRSNYRYGVVRGSTTEDVIKASDNDVHKQMWSRMNGFWEGFAHNLQDGIQKAERERYAFILDTPMAEYVASRQPCKLYTIEPFLKPREYALALPKNSGLKDLINKDIRRMQENFELSGMYEKWWRSECDLPPVTPTPFPTTTTEFYPWIFATAADYRLHIRAASSHNGAIKQFQAIPSIIVTVCSGIMMLMR